MTRYAYAIWQRGSRFKVSQNTTEQGWAFITYHMGSEIQAKACAKAMEEDARIARGGLTRGAIRTPVAEAK